MINVLLAEDEEGDAFLLKEAIEKTDFKTTLHHCWDGAETIAYLEDLKNMRPDFILLDLNMPRVSGHDVLKWVKSNENFKNIPVGILTTSDSQDDIRKSYSNYASFYITKPSSFEDLQGIVNIINEFWVKTVKLPIET